MNRKYPHIQNPYLVQSHPFARPKGQVSNLPPIERDRKVHGTFLKNQIQTIQQNIIQQTIPISKALIEQPGHYIEFESEPGFELKFDSLSNQKAGIELRSLREEKSNSGQPKYMATVFVPEGKIEYFLKKIEDYLTKDTDKGKPKNQPFIANIANIRLATLKSLWTEAKTKPFPPVNYECWWEVWVRVDNDETKRAITLKNFRDAAAHERIQVKKEELVFPDTVVLLVFGTAQQLSNSIFFLSSLYELRKPKETAYFFIELTAKEQNDWIQNLISRLIPANENAPAVCLLDTGVAREHPLLRDSLAETDCQAYDPDWPRFDQDGHGTAMAGLSLFGDLTETLEGQDQVFLPHRLESVKILPPFGQNEPELYGRITKMSMAKAEVQAPYRNRVFSLTVTAKEDRDLGKPSSWSAAIDQDCADALAAPIDKKPRLLVIAGGNVDTSSHNFSYPSSNETEEIHDPGQAWNAITVGAFTTKNNIDPNEIGDSNITPIARVGGLCPRSSTSLEWDDQWPLKPEIVCEGGNLAQNRSSPEILQLDSLRLLTTSRQFIYRRLLETTGDTSAATALAARMCAQIIATYPKYWPETVRGLIIHSAEWTNAMREYPSPAPQDNLSEKKKVAARLRTFGFGVPNLERATRCANNELTLICESHIQPYKKDTTTTAKLYQMNLHPLVWPRDVLLQLGEQPVEMRVTLSYFIEPKPDSTSFRKKITYASYNLRFDVKRPTETEEAFKSRVNALAEKVDEDTRGSSGDSQEWELGVKLRHRGSVHSDIWRGTAANLALKNQIAVYPVGGWWKDMPKRGKTDEKARYALIVSIRTKDINADIYTPVAQLVSIPITT